MKPGQILFFTILLGTVTCTAFAAEVTDVAEPARGKSAAFNVDIGYEYQRESARVSKETYCGPAQSSACDPAVIRTEREFDYNYAQHGINIEPSVGLDVGLEFHLNLPIVASQQLKTKFAPGVNEANSNIDPDVSISQADFDAHETGNPSTFFNSYQYFDLTEQEQGHTNRKGFADPSLGIEWLIISQDNKPKLADLVFAFDYTLPVAPVKEDGNSAVGEGLHKLDFRLAASRQFGVVEPFVSVNYTAPLPAGDRSLFGSDSDNQETDRPGHHIATDVGVSFYIHEDDTSQQSFEFQVGGGFSYTTQGLDYTKALFEPLANSQCNGVSPDDVDYDMSGSPYNPDPSQTTVDAARCAWVAQQPGNSASGDPADGSAAFSHNGLTVEQAHLGYHIRAVLQGRFHPNVGARLGFLWRAEGNHFLSGASTGQDHDDDNVVNLNPSPGDGSASERNPNYNLTYDAVGTRFWVEGVREIGIDAALLLYF